MLLIVTHSPVTVYDSIRPLYSRTNPRGVFSQMQYIDLSVEM
jgi:hypothetical protein